MEAFKIGDRVRILHGVATPFVGHEGVIDEVQPHDRGVETMDRHIVVFEHREKRAFYSGELMLVLRPTGRLETKS